jgi:hypothetical protein
MRQQTVETIQGGSACADTGVGVMETRRHGEHRRTIYALISASVISGLVWGLIVVLHVR